MKKRRLISFFISFTLLLTMCFGSINTDAVVFLLSPESAHAGDYTRYPALADKLTKVFSGDIDIFDEDGKEISMPLGSTMNNKMMYSLKNSAGKDILSGWQCYIYANAVYNVLFGEPGGHGKVSEYKNSEVVIVGGNTASYELFKKKNVLCGAYMRTTIASDGTYSGNNGHSLIILSYDQSKISYIEGNGDSKGLIRLVTTTWADFNKRHLSGRNRYFSHVTQPKQDYYEKLYGDSRITISFNANTGKGTDLDPIKVFYNGTFTLPANQYEKENHNFVGWAPKRVSDGKYLASDEKWYSESEITSKKLTKKIIKNCDTITFNSVWYDNGYRISENESFVFYATWEEKKEDPPVVVAEELVLHIESAKVTSGKTITTTVVVTENPGVALLEVSFSVPSNMKLVNIYDGEVLGNMITLSSNEVEWQLSGDSTRTGILATLSFEVLDNAKVGSYDITPTVVRCCGLKGDTPVNATKGSINVIHGLVECVSVDLEEKTIQVKQSIKINAQVTPLNADNGTVTWTSSNEKVAVVVDGRVTAKSTGDVIITASAGGYSASTKLTVVKVRGDFTGDGVVTTEDAEFLLNYIVFGDIYPLNQGGDLDGDGQITSDDAVYLMNYKNNKDKYPLN